MRILDLFCGTKSIGNSFTQQGFEVITLDSDKQFKPNIVSDILKWDYKILPMNYFDVIWASPPCQCFSVASIGKYWRKGGVPKDAKAIEAQEIVLKTLEIIKYFNPQYWFIENPRAMLRKMPFMLFLPRQTITYCQYGDDRMKPTDIWGTFPEGFKIMSCKNGSNCHISAPRGSRTGTQGIKTSIDRSRIPEFFCQSLAISIKKEILNAT